MNMETALRLAETKAMVAIENQVNAIMWDDRAAAEKWAAQFLLYDTLRRKLAEMLDWSIETGLTPSMEWVKDELAVDGHITLHMVEYTETYQCWLATYMKIEQRL